MDKQTKDALELRLLEAKVERAEIDVKSARLSYEQLTSVVVDQAHVRKMAVIVSTVFKEGLNAMPAHLSGQLVNVSEQEARRILDDATRELLLRCQGALRDYDGTGGTA